MQQENYDVIASFEKDNWWYCAKRDLFSMILNRMERKFSQALDLGCGVGSNFEVLSRFSDKVVGIDFSKRALSYCKRPYSSLHKMDATKMSFPDKTFDLVLCSDVLEHLDDVSAVKEITRILKPGGIFIFSVPAHNYLWGPTDVISNHVKRYEKPDLIDLLSNNYKINKLSYWNTAAFIPDLIFIKLFKLLGKDKKEENALNYIPSALNKIFSTILHLENNWFIRFNNPQGVSIVGVAQKNVI